MASPDAARLAATAAAIGDPARATMLAALLDGRALTATELARAARVAPQTASGHLAKLRARGLVVVAQQGRHRYHRLASPAIAAILESLLTLTTAPATPATTAPARPITVGPTDPDLRWLRTCYDHLAGTLAVALVDRLVARGHLDLAADGAALTAAGSRFFTTLDIPLATRACRPCLDWSERRPHVAGVVGAALLTACLDRRWVRRRTGTRALAVTPTGELALRTHFALVARRPI